MTTYRLNATIQSDETAGISVYDWFDCAPDDHVLDRTYPTAVAAESAAHGCYRGPDVDGIEVAWEVVANTTPHNPPCFREDNTEGYSVDQLRELNERFDRAVDTKRHLAPPDTDELAYKSWLDRVAETVQNTFDDEYAPFERTLAE